MKQIDSEYVVRPIEWIDDKKFYALVLEDVHGKDIESTIQKGPIPVNRFMKLASLIVRGLAAVHRQSIIHQDISPANIIWNCESETVQIIDFDIASRFGVKMSPMGSIEKMQGTIPYISPEQTGRTNRTVDNRSDLYSLGAVFYEMLTGEQPFISHDPVEMIYAHLARDPKSPYSIDDSIPQSLSDLVMKLLSKDAEDRYQSAEGVSYDLEILENQLANQRGNKQLTLGKKDYSGVLLVPEKLYGRENEISRLMDAYQKASRGSKEILLVAGYSGTGKTALVNEIHIPIIRDRGNFISGKFNQLHRSVPYSALTQALDHFCQLILSEKAEVLNQWKEAILESVGELGKVLTDIIPGLELVIGKQPDVPEINGEEAEKRFNFIFLRFFRVISSKEHPLVLFVDDMQWADLASLNLLKLIMEDVQSQYVLIIGAYRDNEVSSSHPMVTAIDELSQILQEEIKTIPVRNLSVEHVGQWLQAALKTSTDNEIADLTGLIYEKTEGNAFFTIQFLENLYKEKLLWFDFAQSEWAYDIPEIEGQNITDNVVDLLAGRIRTLPVRVQEDLKLAACIGNDFDLYTLSVISETDEKEHESSLETSLMERLIYPLGENRYKFVHDRIQQAAYGLTADRDKKPLHLKIGRLLLKRYDMFDAVRETDGAEQRIFSIANHLNMGLELISDPAEQLKLASINLLAAQQARMSGAYTFALDYIQNGVRLLPSDCWRLHYDQALGIYNEAIQVAYLCGNFEEMENHVDVIMTHSKTAPDTRVAYEYRMNSHISQNQPQLGLETLISVYKKLGIAIPDQSEVEAQTGEMLQKIEKMLSQKGADDLRNLPLMQDPEKELALRFFVSGMSAMVYAGPQLLPLVTCKMMELSLEHGFTQDTPFVFVTYGMVRSTFGDTSGAYNIGEITLDLLERLPQVNVNTPKIKYMIYAYLLGWKVHYKELGKQLKENCHYAVNAGDHEYAGYCLTNEDFFLSRTDTNTEYLKQTLHANHELLEQIKQPISIIFSNIEIESTSGLSGDRPEPAVLEIDADHGMPEGIGNIITFAITNRKIYLAYLFDRYVDMAGYLKEAEEAWPFIQVPLVFWKVDFHFYFPLAYAQLYTRADNPEDRENYLQKIQESANLMKQWADFGPQNFLHKHYLLQAELLRITGKTDEAGEYYDLAVEKAFENEYINEAGIANELAAKFYMAGNRDKLASFYFLEARNCYDIWGVKAKVTHLEDTYPKYINPVSPGSTYTRGTISSVTTDSASSFIDIRTILKASHTLSGEVQLKPLLEKMMQILIENAGAQKGMLIENRSGDLFCMAEGAVNGISDLEQETPLDSEKIPLSVIHYVARSKHQVVSDNLSKDRDYSKDDYIQAKQPLSVVCSPVLRKGETAFILYLENNLVEGAFTPTRLEVLNMLSTQIAISIENAQLYENLEEKVRERTEALEKSHEALEKSHKQITDSVNYASRIQKAVLPTPEKIQELLPQNFIVYKPCSVVSGDFYWIRQIDNRIIVVSADCTGHGVSGALVSMQGMAFLNEIVPMLAARDQLVPGQILGELRDRTKTAFEESGGLWHRKEGMDISLCIIDPAQKQIQYAGAYNPLYIVRNNDLIEIKADRMPIGAYPKERPFTDHELAFQDGDILYLFTDGYTDQINKETGKRFNKTRFKELLVEISQEPMDRQKQILEDRFEAWRNGFRQVDDILIFGIQL